MDQVKKKYNNFISLLDSIDKKDNQYVNYLKQHEYMQFLAQEIL